MNKWLVYIALILCCTTKATAQQNIDSLLSVLKTAKEDSNKVLLLLSIGEQYENTQPPLAKTYYNQSLQLSRDIGYKFGELKYASYYSSVLNIQGLFDSSLLINLQAVQLAKQTKDDINIAKASFNTANSYSLLARNDSAMYYYMQILPLLEKMNNKRMLAIAYNNLAKIYRDLGQPQKGVEYGLKALPVLREVKDLFSLEYGLVNLGINYNELKQLDSSLLMLKEALAISQQIGDKYARATILLDIGDIEYQQEEYESCKIKFEQALEIARELELNDTKAIALKGIAMYYLQTKKYALAKTYADSALQVTRQNNTRNQTVKIYKLLADISYASQDLKAAKEYNILTDQLQDSINNDNLQKVTAEYEKKYESRKKDSQIKEQQIILKNRRVLNYLLIGIALALLIIIGLAFRNHKHRQKLQQVKIDELETEKLLTATEAVLKGEEQERSRLAKDLHDGLGGMLSGIKHSLSSMKENLIMTPDNAQAFERSIDMLDSSISEMRRVAHNMMPEMLLKYGLDTALKEFCHEITRSGATKVNYQSIEVDNADINQTVSVTIYRIGQELVNNAIKHGKASEVLVQLHLHQQEKLLALTVEDNGTGFDVNTLTEAKGIGWKNIQSRVDFLKGRLDVQSVPGNGTSVMIEINM
jgi:two-component system NarL family sensor kinase